MRSASSCDTPCEGCWSFGTVQVRILPRLLLSRFVPSASFDVIVGCVIAIVACPVYREVGLGCCKPRLLEDEMARSLSSPMPLGQCLELSARSSKSASLNSRFRRSDLAQSPAKTEVLACCFGLDEQQHNIFGHLGRDSFRVRLHGSAIVKLIECSAVATTTIPSSARCRCLVAQCINSAGLPWPCAP